MYILYGGDFTRAHLIQWLLEQGSIAYELQKVDLFKGEHRSQEFLAMNPAGFVPVLVTPEGEALSEVAALMVYLADRHGLGDLAPAVGDADRGMFLSALFYIATDIQAEMKRFHYPHRYSLRREDDARVQDQAKVLVFARLGVMDGRLQQRGPFILGDRFSLADFYLCYWVAFLDRKGVCAQWPRIAALYDLVRARPDAAVWLDTTEREAAAYAAMQARTPGGIIT